MKRLAIAVVAIGLVVAGCGTSTDEPTGQTGAIAATNDINPHPVEDLRDGGTLRLALSSFPETWNALHLDSDGEIASIMRAMLPKSFVTDASGELSINPNFFTDVALTSTDPQQVTYSINPKAVWSDGSPITWEDIAAQAKALSGEDKAYLIGNTNGFDRVEKVERGVDDQHAVVTYKGHYSEWRGHFAGNNMLYPKEVTDTVEAFDKGYLNGPPKTAGPFMIGSIDKAQNRITLVRNPKWWGPTPKLDSIIYSVLSAEATVPALRNNEIDAVGLGSIDDVKSVQGVQGIAIRRAPSNFWTHLTFNGAPGAILADQNLRLAIMRGIDRQGIVTIALNGMIDNPKPLNNHVYLAGQDGFQDNSGIVAFDPERAKRELDDLGWKLNGEFREKDGKRLEINDVMYDSSGWVQIAQVIQNNLAQIGVKMNIVTKPGQGLFTDVFQPGNFDLGQWSWQGDPFPLSSLRQIWGYYPEDIQGNYGRIGSPELNDLIEQTVTELDPAKARDLANQVDKMVWAEGHSLPMYQTPGNVGVRDNLANYGAFGLASADLTKVGFLK